MNKTLSTLRPVGDDETPELSAELQLAMADVAALAREGLLAMSLGVWPAGHGRDDGVRADRQGRPQARQDPRPHRQPPRVSARLGRADAMARPRARTVEGTEVALETYATFASDDLLRDVVLERMLAGVFCARRAPGLRLSAMLRRAPGGDRPLCGIPRHRPAA